MGTKNGLCFIENDSIHRFLLGNDSKDLSINLMIADERGKLWVGTNNGIYSIAIDENKNTQLDHYGLQNGLLGLEMNMNAAYLDDKGNLFFGSSKGLITFSFPISKRAPWSCSRSTAGKGPVPFGISI